MDGFSGGGGHMQKSWRMRTRRSRPPSMVIISRIRGDVDVRYVKWVKELKSGSGEVVSNAKQNAVKINMSCKFWERDWIGGTYLFYRIIGQIYKRMLYSELGTQSWTHA